MLSLGESLSEYAPFHPPLIGEKQIEDALRSSHDYAVIGKCYKRHRATEFLDFLKRIDSEMPKGPDMHLVMDNYTTHKTPKISLHRDDGREGVVGQDGRHAPREQHSSQSFATFFGSLPFNCGGERLNDRKWG
ncbi:MAG: family transposase [Rhizobium sp.]|nr:family transposase [Rhizobium sp.]